MASGALPVCDCESQAEALEGGSAARRQRLRVEAVLCCARKRDEVAGSAGGDLRPLPVLGRELSGRHGGSVAETGRCDLSNDPR